MRNNNNIKTILKFLPPTEVNRRQKHIAPAIAISGTSQCVALEPVSHAIMRPSSPAVRSRATVLLQGVGLQPGHSACYHAPDAAL